MRRYIAPILPVAMLSAGCSALVLWALRRLGSPMGDLRGDLVLVGGPLVLIALAWLCRRWALAGRLHAASLTIVVYGAVFALLVVTRATIRGDGLLTVVPALMIIILIGAMFAMRAWHLLLGYVFTMAPGWWYGRTVSPEITSEGQYITSAAFFTLATAITFYILSTRFRRTFYGILVEHDERAQRDPLTHLLNREAWYERASATVAQADAEGRDLTVLFIDVDHFKRINDHLGHAAGDEVLVQIARLLRAVMPADALVARFGGEEFVVLRLDCDPAMAAADGRRLQSALRQATFPDLAPTVSIGISHRERGESLDGLLRRADLALLRAKAQGRDRIEQAVPAASGTRISVSDWERVSR